MPKFSWALSHEDYAPYSQYPTAEGSSDWCKGVGIPSFPRTACGYSPATTANEWLKGKLAPLFDSSVVALVTTSWLERLRVPSLSSRHSGQKAQAPHSHWWRQNRQISINTYKFVNLHFCCSSSAEWEKGGVPMVGMELMGGKEAGNWG